jgi:hypothetical protein
VELLLVSSSEKHKYSIGKSCLANVGSGDGGNLPQLFLLTGVRLCV